jgi:hypothetical protein
VLRDSRALAKQLDVIVERLLEIHDGEAIVIKQRRDIRMMIIMKLLDDQLRRQGRGLQAKHGLMPKAAEAPSSVLCSKN